MAHRVLTKNIYMYIHTSKRKIQITKICFAHGTAQNIFFLAFPYAAIASLWRRWNQFAIFDTRRSRVCIDWGNLCSRISGCYIKVLAKISDKMVRRESLVFHLAISYMYITLVGMYICDCCIDRHPIVYRANIFL